MNDTIVSAWEKHLAAEMFSKDVDATMATMIDEPSLFVLPTMKGGRGAEAVRAFYADDFTPGLPDDIGAITVSRRVGDDFLVEELIMTFTHSVEMPWMLPGVAPTGRPVKIPVLGLVGFTGDKLAYEHVWWDQCSVLLQVGALTATGDLPMHGAEMADVFAEIGRGQA
jgi:carboxymethylenebutenolidase